MNVVDLTRRRAELERMGARQPSPARSTSGPVDMRHARRFAEMVEARRPRVFEDPLIAERHAPEPR